MDFLHSILVAAHMFGVALLVGTFFVQMRAKYGFRFDLMLTGASVQLVSGVALYGLAIADGDPNHMKLGIKTLVAVVVFVAALIGFLQARKARASQAALQEGGAVAGAAGVTGSLTSGPRLAPMFHTAGGLAIVNLLIATLWQ